VGLVYDDDRSGRSCTAVAFILLVEDHLDSARPLIRLLSIAGHKVVLAESGEAAIQVAGNLSRTWSGSLSSS
jgi:hypothetical protein